MQKQDQNRLIITHRRRSRLIERPSEMKKILNPKLKDLAMMSCVMESTYSVTSGKLDFRGEALG